VIPQESGHRPRPRASGTTVSADRPWPDAGSATIIELTDEVRRRAKAIHEDADEEAIHDMRTATRRLRTALSLYRDVVPRKARKARQAELRRVARRLGSVRDLDVLIQALGEQRSGDDPLEPLRRAWSDKRQRAADRLRAELGRGRFARSLARSSGPPPVDSDNGPSRRVGLVAPGLIWHAYGRVLAFDLDPRTADPAAVHQMRISAKKFRYTLEAFEDALTRVGPLIESVTGVQDAAGEMHDAIVARDRARTFMETHELADGDRRAITRFVAAQERRASVGRQTTARSLRTVRGRTFRLSLDRAVVALNTKAVGR
jgi:triphosphatase